MNPHTPKWVLTLGVRVPMDFQIFRRQLQRSNSLDWTVPYIVRKLLGLICLKWYGMTQLSTYNISYGQKKGRESNWQFDSWPLKVRNCPDSFACRWRVTYHWESFDEGYNFSSYLISIQSLHTKFWASKVVKVLISGISGFQHGNPGTKWYLSASPVVKHKEYYKGESGGFLEVWAVVSLVSLCLPIVCLCTKSAPTTH